MKRILLLIFILSPFFSKAQKVIAEIAINGKTEIQNAQAIPVGDSIFFTCTQRISGTSFKAAYWISSTGNYRKISVIKEYFEILPFGDSLYYYLINEQGVIQAEITNKGNFLKSSNVTQLKGELQGVFRDNGLNTISIDKKNGKIFFVKIQKDQVIDNMEFQLPDPLAYVMKTAKIEFINGYSPINSFYGIAPFKIYKYNHFLYLTHDRSVMGSKTPNSVKVFKIDLNTKTSQYKEVLMTDIKAFRSFLYEDQLYAFNLSTKHTELRVFDFTGKELQNSTYLLESSNDFNTYFRSGKELYVGKEEPFSRLLKLYAMSTRTISIYKNTEGMPVVQCGTYYNQKGIGVGSFSNPLVGFVTVLAGTAIKQAVFEDPAVTRYFYYKPTLNGGNFTIDPDAQNCRSSLDNFEMKSNIKSMKSQYEYKGYFELGKGILAIHKKEKEGKVTFTYFE